MHDSIRSDEPLHLAAALSKLPTLTSILEFTLPRLAALFDAPLTLFAVAGSGSSGAAIFPRTDKVVQALQVGAGPVWDSGPLTRWCREHPTWSPVRISDVISDTEWQQLPFYVETAQHLGAVYVMYIPVLSPGEAVLGGFLLARADRDFETADLMAASSLQPVLVACHGPLLRDLSRADLLSVRQREVLELTADGLTAYAIGSRIGISINTVRKHLHSAYQRLGVHDRAAAVSELRLRCLAGDISRTWQDATFTDVGLPTDSRRRQAPP